MKKKTLAVVVCGVAATAVFTPPASADPVTDDVCTGFRLGLSPAEIAQRLQENDHRITPQQAWQDTNWPIITGECDN